MPDSLTAKVDAFVNACAQTPMPKLIRNLNTRVERLEVAGHVFPMTINDGGLVGNCYICNPITAYIEYAIEETRHFVGNPALRRSLIGLIRAAKPLMRLTGLDRVVHVNNWLFSTNPAPNIDTTLAATLRDELTMRFPDHAIVIRSLNKYSDKMSLDALRKEGFGLLPSRQVYLFDGGINQHLSRDMQKDAKLLNKMPFERITPSTPQDFARCIELYEMLYLEKYTPLNPQYTPQFLQEMQDAGVLELEVLRCHHDGALVALCGRFQYGDTLTQPLLGYDTSRPQKEGLYRLVTAIAQQAAIKKKLVFNMSAGAAGFKRHRLGVPAVEYSAVYAEHLPQRQRFAINALGGLLNHIGVPLLERYEL